MDQRIQEAKLHNVKSGLRSPTLGGSGPVRSPTMARIFTFEPTVHFGSDDEAERHAEAVFACL
jgi:hypothetical protein